jgi:hypothetical protein
VAQRVVVALVLAARQDAGDAGAHHLQESVLGPFRVAGSSRASAKARVSPICSSY